MQYRKNKHDNKLKSKLNDTIEIVKDLSNNRMLLTC